MARARAEARRRNADKSWVSVASHFVPRDWPEGNFDLVVVSEVIDYLGEADVEALSRKVCASLLSEEATSFSCTGSARRPGRPRGAKRATVSSLSPLDISTCCMRAATAITAWTCCVGCNAFAKDAPELAPHFSIFALWKGRRIGASFSCVPWPAWARFIVVRPEGPLERLLADCDIDLYFLGGPGRECLAWPAVFISMTSMTMSWIAWNIG